MLSQVEIISGSSYIYLFWLAGKIKYNARGFSSFKFLPGSKDSIIVALKTEEVHGETKSYITAFTLDGDILMSDTLVSQKYKYEGVEFLWRPIMFRSKKLQENKLDPCQEVEKNLQLNVDLDQ